MSKGRVVDFTDLRDMTPEERKRVKTVTCGSDCDYCGYEEPRTGVAVVTQLDYFGDVYPEATTIILHHDEWLVQSLDPDSNFGTKVVATYPRDKVVGFRFLPNELRLYSHTVLMPEAG